MLTLPLTNINVTGDGIWHPAVYCYNRGASESGVPAGLPRPRTGIL